MNKITKKIPPFFPFPLLPDKPDQMNEKYPFMHNLFNREQFHVGAVEGSDRVVLSEIGFSDHMDDLENGIMYGGILGRMFLSVYPDHKLERIQIINFVRSGKIPGADPKDGRLQVTWPGKTIRYKKDGRAMEQDVDLVMIYVELTGNAWIFADAFEKAGIPLSALDFSDAEEPYDYESFWQNFKQ